MNEDAPFTSGGPVTKIFHTLLLDSYTNPACAQTKTRTLLVSSF